MNTLIWVVGFSVGVVACGGNVTDEGGGGGAGGASTTRASSSSASTSSALVVSSTTVSSSVDSSSVVSSSVVSSSVVSSSVASSSESSSSVASSSESSSVASSSESSSSSSVASSSSSGGGCCASDDQNPSTPTDGCTSPQWVAFRYVPSCDIDIAEIQLHLGTGQGIALLADNGGHPGLVRGQGAPTDAGGGWASLTLSPPVHALAGAIYWLAGLGDTCSTAPGTIEPSATSAAVTGPWQSLPQASYTARITGACP